MSCRLVSLTFAIALSGCLPSFSIDNPDPNDPNNPDNPNHPDNPASDGGAQVEIHDLLPPPDLAIDPVKEFNEDVAPILEMRCAGCHNKSGGVGPGFLEPNPDVLTMILTYPGLIGTTPETSRIYTKGVHEGPGLGPLEKPIVGDWIKLYNRVKPQPDGGGVAKPTVMPFAPVMGGANTINLDVLDPALAGQVITFDAEMIGTTLKLKNITIVAATEKGVRMVHPLWVTWDANMMPTPDPVDSFSNLDQTVLSGQSSVMGPGTLFLPNFSSGMMLNVVFVMVEAKGPIPDGGFLGCKNVQSWVNNTRPGLLANCTSCHGGANGGATGALPLRAADGDTQNCQNTLGAVDLVNTANSNLFTKPSPNNLNNNHPFHFANQAAFDAFVNAVNVWITAEK
jgi:hypothetical protein